MPKFAIGDTVIVIVIDAAGNEHVAVARSDIEGTHRDGHKIHDFPIVWIDLAGLVPWPAEFVRPANESEGA